MIVLDANILIRAVLGKRVRQLLETYAVHGIRFYAPEVAYLALRRSLSEKALGCKGPAAVIDDKAT